MNSQRITITLDGDNYAALKRISATQRTPMTKIIRELIRETGPTLNQLADTLEHAAKAEKNAAVKFRAALETAEEDLRPMADMIRNQLDLFSDEVERLTDECRAEAGDAPVGRDPASARDPHPLTGGSE